MLKLSLSVDGDVYFCDVERWIGPDVYGTLDYGQREELCRKLAALVRAGGAE